MAYARERGGRWYACWVDPHGKQRSKACGKGSLGKKVARQLVAELETSLRLGTYDDKKSTDWETFVAEYTAKKLVELRARSQDSAKSALQNFKRLMQPRTVRQVDEEMLDDYIRLRRQEPGKQPGTKVSAHTVNRELRTLRAALRVATRWRYRDYTPEINFLSEEARELEFISAAQFSKLFAQCCQSILPGDLPNGVTPQQWWQGLLIFIYMTGWRINQTLLLEWDCVDLKTGLVQSPAAHNKGRRDIRCQLHPVVLEHLAPLQKTFATQVFPWSQKSTKSLYLQFRELQRAAKVTPQHKPWYGFHDLRRGFATANAANLDLFELQRLMQHKSLETTKRYVAMAHRSDTVLKLQVPQLKTGTDDATAHGAE